MAWNQRNARFYCEVDSARTRTEKILANERTGLTVRAAGEHGMVHVYLRAQGRSLEDGPRGKRRNLDQFEVFFCPWRSCEDPSAPSILIAKGPLDYDKVRYGEAMVRFDDKTIETYRTIRAMEVMSEK